MHGHMYSCIFYYMFLLMLLRPNTEFFARYTITGDNPLSVEAYSTRSSLITYFPRSSRPIATGKVTPFKGHCHEIFNLMFFHESVSPKPLSIPLSRLEFFQKYSRYSQLKLHHRFRLPPVANGKKSAIRKVFIIFF
jgi:hypothetical protein